MTLPLSPPLKPELALSRKALPEGEDYVYEVKLDGFRCIAFVDGEEIFLQSRNGKTLGRYFPELLFPPGRWFPIRDLAAWASRYGSMRRSDPSVRPLSS